MTALEFIRGHVIFKLCYDQIYQMTPNLYGRYETLKNPQILVNQGVGVIQWSFSDLRFVLPGYMH